MPSKNLWSREELILAFNLYLKLPFGKHHKGTPEIIALANLIGRTPSSIAMRLGNYASVDPYHQNRGIGGLKGGTNQVKPIWDEFFENQEELIFLSENIRANFENTTIEKKYNSILSDISHLEGKDIERTVKTRINQAVFREMVLVNYESRCAISGLDIPQLLRASHIVPWAANIEQRLNPENGLCLSPLYDSAFDKGFLTISTDLKIVFSKRLKTENHKDYFHRFFMPFEGKSIIFPIKYYPKKEFLEFHQESIFIR